MARMRAAAADDGLTPGVIYAYLQHKICNVLATHTRWIIDSVNDMSDPAAGGGNRPERTTQAMPEMQAVTFLLPPAPGHFGGNMCAGTTTERC